MQIRSSKTGLHWTDVARGPYVAPSCSNVKTILASLAMKGNFLDPNLYNELDVLFTVLLFSIHIQIILKVTSKYIDRNLY